MKLEFGIGNGVQSVEVPRENLIGVLMANEVPLGLTGEVEVRRALNEPIGSKPLREIVKPGEKIAIITSDITRPMPTHAVMPALLEELFAAGVEAEDITLVFALGVHRPHTIDEQQRLAGEHAFWKIRCVDSDSEDVIHLGETKAGTPVDITSVVAQADRRICLGNIEYHYFAGYSGGAKAIMPGVSTRAAIQANHRMMVLPEACAGHLEDNPLRMDLEEGAAICGIDFILNVVLDEHKRIVRAVAGDSVLAHREGCRFLDKFYLKEIPRRADIVLVSQGGAPKDLNLYQTQKALDNAKHAVSKGGVIILIGSCREGFGENVLIDRIGQSFELGGHKAAAIAMVLQDADIYLVSDLEDGLVRRIFMEPYPTVQEAFDAAMRKLGSWATVLVMPYGGSTLPRVQSDN
jgi:nickel-dependent lactate racemase